MQIFVKGTVIDWMHKGDQIEKFDRTNIHSKNIFTKIFPAKQIKFNWWYCLLSAILNLVFPAVLEHNEYCISDLIAFNAKVMRVCLGVNIDKWPGSAVDINCLPTAAIIELKVNSHDGAGLGIVLFASLCISLLWIPAPIMNLLQFKN